MYCKNCGRELKDDIRFCDRCGQSVRQNGNNERAERRKEIEALKEERLNRKKRLADMEAEKAEKKSRKKKNIKRINNKLIYLIVAVLIILLSAIISYMATKKGDEDAAWKIKDESVELNATPLATQQPMSEISPSPEAEPLPVITAEKENTDPINDDGYRVFEISDKLKCPYPTASFIKKEADSERILNLMDTVGGATMTVTTKKNSGSKASELMKEYAQSLGGTISYSLAGNDWYGVTIEKNSLIYHRKCLIMSDKQIYYDFQYDKNSVSASDYETYIQYIDEKFVN